MKTEVYYFAVEKHGELLYLAAGPYLSLDEINDVTLPDLSPSCSYVLVKHEIEVSRV